MKIARIMVGIATCGLFCRPCFAETRWCTINAQEVALVYPPIAKAAHVSGSVIGRLIFETSGSVLRLEDASGPVLLAKSVSDQIMNWKLLTDAQGSELCQGLLIANFTIGDGTPAQFAGTKTPPGMLRVAVHAEVLVISDPAGTITTSLWWKMNHLFKNK